MNEAIYYAEPQKTLIDKHQQIYNATIRARNQFTKEFASRWSDTEIRVLALFKYYFKKNSYFSLPGMSGARYCYISRPTWIKIVKKLEALGLIEVERDEVASKLTPNGKPRCQTNSYFICEQFEACLKQSHTQITHKGVDNQASRPNAPEKPSNSVKTAKPPEKNFGATCKAPLQLYNINNYNNTNTTTAKSVNCRSATPPRYAEKGLIGKKFFKATYPERVESLEKALEGLKQLPDDKSLVDEKAKDLTENSHFFKTLLALNPDVAMDMASGKFGLIDGLHLVVKPHIKGLSFGLFLSLLETHGRLGCLMMASVAYKVKIGWKDPNDNKISNPVGYLRNALKNPDGVRPCLSLSHLNHLSAEEEIGLDALDTKEKQKRIAWAWARTLASKEKEKLYKRYHSSIHGVYFADNIDDPEWMISAYGRQFGHDWSGFAHLKVGAVL